MSDVQIAFGMLVGAAIPGFVFYLLVGRATWLAILSGVLAVLFGLAGGCVVLAIQEGRDE